MIAALLATVLGYWAPDHQYFNEQLLRDGKPFQFSRAGKQVRNVDDYLQRVLYVSDGTLAELRGVSFRNDPRGEDKPTDPSDSSRSLLEWNKKGGLWEDGFENMDEATDWGGLRAVNHFHDPLAFGGGYNGIKTETGFTAHWQKEKSGKAMVDLFRAGMSVTRWAQGGSSTEKNEWGYPTVSRGFLDFLTKPTQEERETALATAFRAMGQLEHLITDNTVPDHARDLAHPGDGFEEYLHGQSHHFGRTPLPWPPMPLERIAQGGVRAFWDQDVYSGANPADGLAVGAGIAEYTQANFLAWNRFTPPLKFHIPWLIINAPNPSAYFTESDILYFTTVPERTGEGFGHFPYPRLTGPSDGHFGAEPPGQQFPTCVARERTFRNTIEAPCWDGYAEPLMKRAHGTALTVFKLSMPPLRAEVIPVPGNFNAFQVRLWNLGAGAGDAVTLNLDKVSLSSVKFEGAPMGTVAVASLGPGEAQLAPGGAPWTSPQFTLSLTEQGLLKFSTFSAVVVEARLAGLDPAPVKMSVPIPNGFPVVNQLTSTVPLNSETHAIVTESNCCSTMCTPCGENAEYVQPVTQTITGFIGRYSSRLDTLGRPAFGTTKSAIDSDTRIAGVTLVAWGRLGARYDAPIRMNRSSLTITNSQLFEQRGDTWVRKEGAPDEADPDRLGFTATVDVRDFYSATAGSAASTQTVHLVVWMTSGAVYTQNVALWPMRRPETVAAAIAGSELCTGVNGLRNMQYEAASGCRSSVTGTPPMCSNGSWNSSTRKVIFGPLRGLGTADSEYFALYPNLKLLKLAGVDVASLSATCDPSTVNLGTNFMLRCFSDYNSFIMENVTDGRMGACPMISTMPSLPREATMLLDWPPELRMIMLKVFGREDLPAFENVELR